ncbi:unnamed protein product [Lepidochelys olivacea]
MRLEVEDKREAKRFELEVEAEMQAKRLEAELELKRLELERAKLDQAETLTVLLQFSEHLPVVWHFWFSAVRGKGWFRKVFLAEYRPLRKMVTLKTMERSELRDGTSQKETSDYLGCCWTWMGL